MREGGTGRGGEKEEVLSELPVGLLVTFNVRALKNGLRRLWLSDPKSSKSSSSPSLPVNLSRVR
jgi:hypothetical protein